MRIICSGTTCALGALTTSFGRSFRTLFRTPQQPPHRNSSDRPYVHAACHYPPHHTRRDRTAAPDSSRMPPLPAHQHLPRVITYYQTHHDEAGKHISVLPLLSKPAVGLTHLIVAAIRPYRPAHLCLTSQGGTSPTFGDHAPETGTGLTDYLRS